MHMMTEYSKPEIADYGALRELTEGCGGPGADGGSISQAQSDYEPLTSNTHCGTLPGK
jgi:hypothetical protein